MRPSSSKEQENHEPPVILGFSPLEITLVSSGVVLLLAFLYLMQEMVTPPILAGAGIILLWPVRVHRPVQAILLTGGFLLIFWFLHRLSSILIPFASVYVVAYLFDPVVSHLKKQYRIGRWASSLVVTFLLVSAIALFVLLLAPNLISQLDALGTRALSGIQELQEWMMASHFINELEVAGLDKEELIAQFATGVKEFLTFLTSSIPRTLEQVLLSMESVFSVITILVLTPVILFYTLKDYGLIKQGIKRFLPTFGGQQLYLSNTSHILGQYLRGQLMISAITALLVSVALMLGNIPFALLIGMLAGMLNLIPSLGAIITNIIGICIVLLFGERGIIDVVIVVAVLLGQSVLEQAVLVPKILSRHVGLHPVVILLSLFVFGYFFGFVGLFIAVPMTALIMTTFDSISREMSLDLASFLAFSPASNVRDDMSSVDTKNLDYAEGVTFNLKKEPTEQLHPEINDAAAINEVAEAE